MQPKELPKEPFKCATHYCGGVMKQQSVTGLKMISSLNLPQNFKLFPCTSKTIVRSNQQLISNENVSSNSSSISLKDDHDSHIQRNYHQQHHHHQHHPHSHSHHHHHQQQQQPPAVKVDNQELQLQKDSFVYSLRHCPETINNGIQNKPLAKVSPLVNSKPFMESKAVQTDAWSIDLDALCPLEDYARSRRIDSVISIVNSDPIPPYDCVALSQRIEEMEHALKIQITVNRDIKKLLIASVGVDFSEKIEDLTRTNEEANQKIYQLNHRVNEYADQMDRISIESDLWQSKFIASRVMLDEMAGWKQCILSRYQESITALKMILTEHGRLMEELYSTRELLLCAAEALLPPHNRPSELQLAQTEEGGGGGLHEESPSWLQYCVENRRLVRSLCLNIPGTKLMNHLVNSGSHRHNKTSSTTTTTEENIDNGTAEKIEEYSIRTLIHDLSHHQRQSPGEKLSIEVLRNHLTVEMDPTRRYRCAYNSPESQKLERLTVTCCKSCKGESFIV